VLAKAFAWLLTDSVVLLATLIDSMLDAVASLVMLFAVHKAVAPPDKEHRFGHGKAEALAGLGQSAFIAGSAGFLLLEAGRRLLHPVPIESFGPGLIVMGFSIALTLVLMLFQHHVIRKTNSTAIKADALHYRTDFIVNGSVIIALLLAANGWPGFDALFAIGIAIYILHSSWEIVRQALDDLMDRELPDSERESIKRIVLAHSDVRDLHDLRSRRSGVSTFIQLHLEVDDAFSILQAHGISDRVERALQQAYPNAEIIIHVDPSSAVLHEPVVDYS
jgi:ferrous-iron efflux pump FieF